MVAPHDSGGHRRLVVVASEQHITRLRIERRILGTRPEADERVGDEAVVRIDDGSILIGGLPTTARRLVEEWRRQHRKELLDNWALDQ